MRTFLWTLAVIFLLFAGVQYNDPDPLVWMALYGSVSLLCALAALGISLRWPAVALAAVTALWMLTLAPAMLDWARMGYPTIVGSMKAEAPHIELVREFLGLLLALLAQVYLLRMAWRRPRP
jgi:hypothetical protein